MLTMSDEEFFDQIDSESETPQVSIIASIHNFLYGYLNNQYGHQSSIAKILSIGTSASVLLYYLTKTILHMYDKIDILHSIGCALIKGYISGIFYPIMWMTPFIKIKFSIRLNN